MFIVHPIIFTKTTSKTEEYNMTKEGMLKGFESQSGKMERTELLRPTQSQLLLYSCSWAVLQCLTNDSQAAPTKKLAVKERKSHEFAQTTSNWRYLTSLVLDVDLHFLKYNLSYEWFLLNWRKMVGLSYQFFYSSVNSGKLCLQKIHAICLGCLFFGRSCWNYAA